MTVAAVVTAAGSGTRLGADVPKALLPIEGRALVAWALDGVCETADAVVVTAPAAHLDAFREAVDGRATVVAGGQARQQSVALGLAALDLADHDIVLIHDAARAFQPVETMRATVAAVESGADGAIPVLPVVDTLVAAPAPDGTLGEPVDRDAFRTVQTPQTFRARVALDAHARGRAGATDDATLARELGYRIVAVDGHEWGFKVTLPADLPLALHIASLKEDA
ncbi:2-C-methyl-D-erythritol 4-phosphate cytidylyltransferase [Demequina activiva]|uniref:2-C-methyl-D-erythritol 4-phosphate cytidylyltransferase n=1 Tax=Demequina activiva TaxID=1582364 RepID=A0A919Q2L1_9MICO|nr:2-C-methyl-D-erythritol 4-phosphate cytidylyltransferase [Demequina activiva]GIG53721.1 2-C-methyl-D-erythritol 4-phosphate cytidylyltransferase [Demequina activiva]